MSALRHSICSRRSATISVAVSIYFFPFLLFSAFLTASSRSFSAFNPSLTDFIISTDTSKHRRSLSLSDSLARYSFSRTWICFIFSPKATLIFCISFVRSWICFSFCVTVARRFCISWLSLQTSCGFFDFSTFLSSIIILSFSFNVFLRSLASLWISSTKNFFTSTSVRRSW